MTELLIDDNVIGETLTPKQEAFCRYYTQIAATFGNGTLSYAEAYGYDLDNASKDDAVYEKNKDGINILVESCTYDKIANICAVGAHRLVRSSKIDKYIRQLLNEMMDNNVVDARLIEIIIKGKDQDSVNAIKEFNKLKQRITEKIDHTSGGKAIDGFNFVRNDTKDTTNNQADS